MQIALVHFVLTTRSMSLRSTQILAHHGNGTIEDALARHAQLRALRLENAPKFGIHKREEHQPRLLANVRYDPLELALAPHQCIEMFLQVYVFELCTGRFGNGVQRLARRIGDKMQVKSARLIHFDSQTSNSRNLTPIPVSGHQQSSTQLPTALKPRLNPPKCLESQALGS